MAKIIDEPFINELTELFNKYHKTIKADKGGIYIVDNDRTIHFFLMIAENASDNPNPTLLIGYED